MFQYFALPFHCNQTRICPISTLLKALIKLLPLPPPVVVSEKTLTQTEVHSTDLSQMKHTVCTNVAYFSTNKNLFHQNNVKAAYLCSGFRCYYSTQHNDVKYPFIFTQCWCTACVNASAWRCWACLLLLCPEVKLRLTDCSREGGCSVPDGVQTAVPPEALQSIHTLSRLLQTAHAVLASSKNTARFHPAARLIRSDGFSMIHPVGTQSLVQHGV